MTTCRILLLDPAPPPGLPMAGNGWRLVESGGDGRPGGASRADVALLAADSPLAEAQLDRLALPLFVHVGGHARPALLDRADGWWLAGDDGAAMDRLVAAHLARDAGSGVADSADDGPARQIAALSAEAQRIAEALAALAAAGEADPAALISPALVRRIIRLRRDRERHFPAELFADPAWDMLLDLTAARMESAEVPVSSLCVAAGVPTTTALRWIRTLSEAGLFVRHTDPADGRRSFIALSDTAHQAMQAWIRRFAAAFQLR